MQILAHRGYWKQETEKNTLAAIGRAFENGYGIETDLRDYNGRLVVSHNVADSTCPDAEELFKLYRSYGKDLPLALNVKADGIQGLLKELFDKYDIKNYFMFDMSVPEQVMYVAQKFNTFTRQSEFEQSPSMYEDCCGVWMDEFSKDWILSDSVRSHLQNGKRIGVISSEIHKRPQERLWKLLSDFKSEDNLMLCTDIPKEAEKYFYG